MTDDDRRATALRQQAELSVYRLFDMCRPVIWVGWDAQTHARHVALLIATRDRVIKTMDGLSSAQDFKLWLDRWTPALGQVAKAYINGHPVDAYQRCSCWGTIEPVGTVTVDEGDGSAEVSTRCTLCGRQGVHYWTAGEEEYRLTFGHVFGETDPTETGEIHTAEEWCVALNEDRRGHDWALDEQVAHAQAVMSAAGVPLTGVMARGAKGGTQPEAVLTTAAWVVGWNHETSSWTPLTHPDGGT